MPNSENINRADMESREWIFPQIPLYDNIKLESASKSEEILALKAEISQLKMQLHNTASEYTQKMHSINELIQNLENSITFFDTEIQDLFQKLIAKCTKKLIQREIHLDTTVIYNIIEAVKELLRDTVSPIVIYLSHENLEKLSQDGLDNSILIRGDHTLSSGDIVVKSENFDIDGKLESRINLILGI